jgi:hypothetical protein
MSGIAEVAAAGASRWPSAFLGLLSPSQSLGPGFATTCNVFSFRKDSFDAATIEGLPAFLKILAAIQTISVIILLFLLGLSVCNKFPMK